MKNFYYASDEYEKITISFPKESFVCHAGIDNLRYYLLVMYLRKHFDTCGRITTSLKDIAYECGYQSKTHRAEFYMSFRNILHELENEEYLTIDTDINTIAPIKYFNIQLSHNKNLFYTSTNFVLFNAREFEILTHIKTNVSTSVLTAIYLFIKQYISLTDENHIVSSPSKQAIAETLGITSSTTIDKALLALEENGMMYSRSDLLFRNMGKQYLPARTVFALRKDDLTDKNCKYQLQNWIYRKPIFTRAEYEKMKLYPNNPKK